MDMSATVVTLTSGQAPAGGPLPSGQEIRDAVVSLASGPTLSRTSPPVNKTNASLPPVARGLTDMANIATITPMSGTAAARSCTPLPENSTTVSTECLPSKNGASTSSSHHFVSSVPVISARSTLECPAVSAPANTETWPPTSNSNVSKLHGSPPPTGHDLPSQVACAPTSLSPITTTPFTQGTATSTTPGTPGVFHSTSAPPSITSTGLTTLADGTVVPMTQAMANSAQGASGSSPGHAFFGNHPVVISVFLVSGMVVAFIVILALHYCRRRQREDQHDGEKLQDISAPFPPNHFTMREHVSPHGRWDGFVRSGDQHTPMRSSSSILLSRGEDSVPATQAVIDTRLPLPPPPSLQQQQQQQRTKNRLSYRVPVPYTGLAAHGNNSQAADRQYVGPFSDYHPAQAVQKLTTPTVPPLPPKRSPLRLLATKNDPKTPPQENTQRLSGTSSLSIYPPSLYPSDADVDSLYQKEVGIFRSRDTSDSSTKGPSSGNHSGMERKKDKASKNNKSTVLGGVDFGGASSSWKRALQR